MELNELRPRREWESICPICDAYDPNSFVRIRPKYVMCLRHYKEFGTDRDAWIGWVKVLINNHEKRRKRFYRDYRRLDNVEDLDEYLPSLSSGRGVDNHGTSPNDIYQKTQEWQRKRDDEGKVD